jgi:hypothetical protein
MQEWLNKIVEQLSDSNIVYLVHHAGGDHQKMGTGEQMKLTK